MNHFSNIAALFAVLFATNALAENVTYLCVSEESTGFKYKNDSWGQVQFNVTDEKYIVRAIKETEFGFSDKKNPYGVFPLGATSPVFRCSISEYSNNILCRVGIGEFLFSPDSGRFISTYTDGYWDGADDNENTPAITRGRCSIIDYD